LRAARREKWRSGRQHFCKSVQLSREAITNVIRDRNKKMKDFAEVDVESLVPANRDAGG
jgi:hypothetical protein